MVRMNDTWDRFMQGDSTTDKCNGRREQVTPLNFIETMRSFNERLMKSQEDQNQINATIFDSLIDIQQGATLVKS